MATDAATLRPGYFTLDVIRTTAATSHVAIPGWTDGELWNGWQTPHFERDAADLLAETMEQLDILLTYDAERDAYISPPEDYNPDGDEDVDPDDILYYHGQDVALPDGRALHLYSVGTWVWCWEPAGIP